MLQRTLGYKLLKIKHYMKEYRQLRKQGDLAHNFVFLFIKIPKTNISKSIKLFICKLALQPFSSILTEIYQKCICKWKLNIDLFEPNIWLYFVLLIDQMDVMDMMDVLDMMELLDVNTMRTNLTILEAMRVGRQFL